MSERVRFQPRMRPELRELLDALFEGASQPEIMEELVLSFVRDLPQQMEETRQAWEAELVAMEAAGEETEEAMTLAREEIAEANRRAQRVLLAMRKAWPRRVPK